jgi:hypothetical protein
MPGKPPAEHKIAAQAAKSSRFSGEEVGSGVELLEHNTAEGSGFQAPAPSAKQPFEQIRRSPCSPFQVGVKMRCSHASGSEWPRLSRAGGAIIKTTVDHALMRGLATAEPVMRRGALPALDNRPSAVWSSSNSTPEPTSSPNKRLDLAACSAILLSAGGFSRRWIS